MCLFVEAFTATMTVQPTTASRKPSDQSEYIVIPIHSDCNAYTVLLSGFKTLLKFMNFQNNILMKYQTPES